MNPYKDKDYSRVIDFFEHIDEFETEDDIPDIPITTPEIHQHVIIPNLIRCGAIPLNECEVGETYLGACRNASRATFVGGCQFEYERHKGTTYTETINHFEVDDGYDLFVPLKKI